MFPPAGRLWQEHPWLFVHRGRVFSLQQTFIRSGKLKLIVRCRISSFLWSDADFAAESISNIDDGLMGVNTTHSIAVFVRIEIN